MPGTLLFSCFNRCKAPPQLCERTSTKSFMDHVKSFLNQRVVLMCLAENYESTSNFV